MTEFSLSLDPEHYLGGALASGQGADTFLQGGWQAGAQGDTGPDTPRKHAEVLAALGLIYLRHGEAARAMVLGLAAMSMGDLRPKTILMVAEAILTAGDPRQALAVLGRFDKDTALSSRPSPTEHAARHYIAARIHHRLGDSDQAQSELMAARQTRAQNPEEDDA